MQLYIFEAHKGITHIPNAVPSVVASTTEELFSKTSGFWSITQAKTAQFLVSSSTDIKVLVSPIQAPANVINML